MRNMRFLARIAAALIICTMSFMVLTIPFSQRVYASPFYSDAVVLGAVDDMWLDSGACYFKIHISWSESSILLDQTINAEAKFLNESDDSYDSIASSQGWRIGDTFNATLIHYGDERSEFYSLCLISKSDVNFAEPLTFLERNPLVLWGIVFIAVIVGCQIIVRCIFKRKRGSRVESVEHDYFRFLKRI